jgi:hypothetical protein
MRAGLQSHLLHCGICVSLATLLYFVSFRRLQRLLAFYFQKKSEDEEKAAVKSTLQDGGSGGGAAAPSAGTARSAAEQEHAYVPRLRVTVCLLPLLVTTGGMKTVCWRLSRAE